MQKIAIYFLCTLLSLSCRHKVTEDNAAEGVQLSQQSAENPTTDEIRRIFYVTDPGMSLVDEEDLLIFVLPSVIFAAILGGVAFKVFGKEGVIPSSPQGKIHVTRLGHILPASQKVRPALGATGELAILAQKMKLTVAPHERIAPQIVTSSGHRMSLDSVADLRLIEPYPGETVVVTMTRERWDASTQHGRKSVGESFVEVTSAGQSIRYKVEKIENEFVILKSEPTESFVVQGISSGKQGLIDAFKSKKDLDLSGRSVTWSEGEWTYSLVKIGEGEYGRVFSFERSKPGLSESLVVKYSERSPVESSTSHAVDSSASTSSNTRGTDDQDFRTFQVDDKIAKKTPPWKKTQSESFYRDYTALEKTHFEHANSSTRTEDAFFNEISSLHFLREDPGAPQFFGAYQTKTELFTFMEKAKGSLKIEKSTDFSKSMAALEVLAKMHREGRVHRDLKPDNFLVSTNGKWLLSDYGSVVVPQLGYVTKDASSLFYVSPEYYLYMKKWGLDESVGSELPGVVVRVVETQGKQKNVSYLVLNERELGLLKSESYLSLLRREPVGEVTAEPIGFFNPFADEVFSLGKTLLHKYQSVDTITVGSSVSPEFLARIKELRELPLRSEAERIELGEREIIAAMMRDNPMERPNMATVVAHFKELYALRS